MSFSLPTSRCGAAKPWAVISWFSTPCSTSTISTLAATPLQLKNNRASASLECHALRGCFKDGPTVGHALFAFVVAGVFFPAPSLFFFFSFFFFFFFRPPLFSSFSSPCIRSPAAPVPVLHDHLPATPHF